ncbi:MAG: radical SAM protein [candidate division Zixibacteria bacterium]|nr:radical SAM protein [candidate division Zixibacteria bacterium]
MPLQCDVNQMENEVKRCLPLKKGVIYGPVPSRRLGDSLGINLSPTERKICSFNCVYCHYGWSNVVTMDTEKYEDQFPSIEEVTESLEAFLLNNPQPGYITFSGNGEPSTHPRFHQIVPEVLKIRDKLAPGVKVTILSNSTTAGNPTVMDALRKLDIRFMKLDCGDEMTFKRFNRPAAGVTLDGIIENLSKMDMPIIFQTMLADGKSGNFNRSSINGFVAAVGKTRPESIQLYSLDRPTPDGSLRGLTKEQLRELSERIVLETGIPVEIFGKREV